MNGPNVIYVDGILTPATGTVLEVINPSTGERVFEFADASTGDVDRTVAAARSALVSGRWSTSTVDERILVIERLRDLMLEQGDEFARLSTLQMGAPISGTRNLVQVAAMKLDAYIDAARATDLEFVRRDARGQALVRREPVGVVGTITAWNGPLTQLVSKMVPALLAGCTLVAKPAPETPSEALLLAGLATEAGLPPGVFNVVTGGRTAGERLVEHPDIQKITFTGSTTTGRSIAASCAGRFTRTSLELGGKSAAIVLTDADLPAAARIIAAGNYGNAGQACIAPTRVLVPRALHDELLGLLCAEAARLVVGDPLDERTTMGPVVSAAQRGRIESYVRSAVDEGAEVVFGGGRPAGLARGWYVEPTVVDQVENSMRIAREEIFGPVMSVLTYDTVEEAIEIANDNDYGLHGCVFSADDNQALAVAKKIRTGSIAINGYGITSAAPFGGVKASGIGREHGKEGLGAFLEYKQYAVTGKFATALENDGTPAG